MKKLLIITLFVIFASPAFAAELEVFLTNQNGDKTTQFETGDSIYIEGLCAPASQEIVKIYIAPDKTWQDNDSLSDVSGNIETFAAYSDGNIPRLQIWKTPLNVGLYDVVIDTNNNGTLESYEKVCLIGLIDTGFRVGNPITPAPEPEPAPTTYTAPTPTPEPTTITVSAEPSTFFSLDEYVEVKNLSNVRKSAGGTLLGAQSKGAMGSVVEGPVQATLNGNNYWFWNINFEDDPDGWVAESTLKNSPAPEPEPVEIENIPEEVLPDVQTTAPETTSSNNLVAQASTANNDSKASPLVGSLIIGAALFFGLILGSMILAKAIRRV